MFPEVAQVKPNDDYTVYVYFSDGKPVACGFTVESVTEEEIAGIFTT